MGSHQYIYLENHLKPMTKAKLKIRDNTIFWAIILLSLVSAMRSFLLPLAADEITYSQIGEELLKGKYYLRGAASTVTPIIPLLYAIFKIKSLPLLGYVLHKLFHFALAILGGRYAYLFFFQLGLSKKIILALLALVAANPIAVAWFANLYPEAILFFSFWGFIYYSVSPKQISNIPKILAFFVILVLTRYLYAVLGVILVSVFIGYLKTDYKKYRLVLFKYCIVFALPIFLWGKYMFNVEYGTQDKPRISYFKRFQSTDSPILYNLKCGLGLEKHHEVDKINGIPAFASLFIPITGFRNYLISVILILAFVYGLLLHVKLKEIKILLIATLLPMLGLMFAGTGFSRYWLILLPSFCLGYYYLFKRLNFKEIYFVRIVQIVAFVYIVNEFRLDVLVLSKIL